MDTPDNLLPVVEETRYGGKRGVGFKNAYDAEHSGISFYDPKAYEEWNEGDRSKESAKRLQLPYEITWDDRRSELNWNEAEARVVAAQLNAIIAEWDAKQ